MPLQLDGPREGGEDDHLPLGLGELRAQEHGEEERAAGSPLANGLRTVAVGGRERPRHCWGCCCCCRRLLLPPLVLLPLPLRPLLLPPPLLPPLSLPLLLHQPHPRFLSISVGSLGLFVGSFINGAARARGSREGTGSPGAACVKTGGSEDSLGSSVGSFIGPFDEPWTSACAGCRGSGRRSGGTGSGGCHGRLPAAAGGERVLEGRVAVPEEDGRLGELPLLLL